ncbi:MAG: hypothetical protein U1F83_17360 [Verrucomicrobiota bacterium]
MKRYVESGNCSLPRSVALAHRQVDLQANTGIEPQQEIVLELLWLVGELSAAMRRQPIGKRGLERAVGSPI